MKTDIPQQSIVTGHPRLYFAPDELLRLRKLRSSGGHARIWRNLAASADWYLTKTPRTEWIAPVSPDPIYLNLYDRFYGMMFDMAAMEHLAFAYAYSGEDRYFAGAREWALACCRVWGHEAEGEADANKAYAVMRLLKGLAISYDLLYDRLINRDREELRDALIGIGRKYYQWYLDNPAMGTMAQGPHHASVEVTSFGIAALALLGELPEMREWLELMVKKMVESLLPYALTPSGAQTEGMTFYTSTMQYRLLFMDPLRRVTGTDLFTPFVEQMSGRLALAKIAGEKAAGWDENHRTIIHEPCYGQLSYWSPVLLYLAREYRRPIYQCLAGWDETLGSIQRTRFITPNGEELAFAYGGYAYAWYDSTVPAEVEPDLPLSFAFPETHEAYARGGYQPGDLVLGYRQGWTVVHAGGGALFVDKEPMAQEGEPGVMLVDDGQRAVITGQVGEITQTLALDRPNHVRITRATPNPVAWWCHERPERDGNSLRWPDGTELRIVKGTITSFEPEGHLDWKITGLNLLKCNDPMPMHYPLVTAEPEDGELVLDISLRSQE
ncbi:MAG: DUF4962 domain-containing protein [Armatimonadota bacterium]